MSLVSEKDRKDVGELLSKLQANMPKEAQWAAAEVMQQTFNKQLAIAIPKIPEGYRHTTHFAENDLKVKWAPLTNDGCGDAEWSSTRKGQLRGASAKAKGYFSNMP